MAPCVACHRPFTFNPHKVPSVTLDPARGREPICRACVERVNPSRVANGLPAIVILDGAYDVMPAAEL